MLKTGLAIAALGVDGLIPYVQSIGLYRNKAKNLLETCRLLIERNDALLGMLTGGSSIMQEGDFTFQRDAAGNGWRRSIRAALKLSCSRCRRRRRRTKRC